MMEAMRFLHPQENHAYSRIEAKLVNGAFKFSASRLDHIIVCNEIISNNLLLKAGIDSGQELIASDHFPVFISLDLSKHKFEKIEFFQYQGVSDPNWRQLNLIISEHAKGQNEETPEEIKAFIREIEKSSRIFRRARMAVQTMQNSYDQQGIAESEMREKLDYYAELMHKITYDAALQAEKSLKASKEGKSKDVQKLEPTNDSKEDKGKSKAKDAAEKKGSSKKKFHISNEFSSSKKSLFLTLQEIRIEYLKIRRMFSLAAPID